MGVVGKRCFFFGIASLICGLAAGCGDDFTDQTLANPNAGGSSGSAGSDSGGSSSNDGGSNTGGGNAGGSAGSSGAGGQSSSGPRVVSVSPDADAVDVGFDSEVTATFSSALDASTVTAVSFELARGNSGVSGTVSYADLVATFTPAEPLALRSTYTATLAPAITDPDGASLVDAPYSWSFTTADGTWSDPGVVELNAGPVELPQVAMDGSGNAVAVWAQSDGSVYSIWANRFLPATGWGEASLIETVDTGDAHYPKIAMDSSGRVVVVWNQSDGAHVNVWASFTQGNNPWSDPMLLEDLDTDSFQQPAVAIDESGNAVAVWSQAEDSDHVIRANVFTWANRTDPAGGWGDAEIIQTGLTDAYDADVAMAPDGQALVVWAQSNGVVDPQPTYQIWSNRYVPGMGWDEATRVPPDTSNGWYTRLAMNSSGDAALVWVQTGDVKVARYSRATDWGMATTIETYNAGYAFEPEIAIDEKSNIVVVWDHYNGLNYNSLWSNQFRDGEWGMAALVEMDDSGRTDFPKLALDPSGNGVMVWSQRDGFRYNIWTSRYDAAEGWGDPAMLEMEDIESGHPRVAVDARGNAMAVWEQGTPDPNVMSVYFH